MVTYSHQIHVPNIVKLRLIIVNLKRYLKLSLGCRQCVDNLVEIQNTFVTRNFYK